MKKQKQYKIGKTKFLTDQELADFKALLARSLKDDAERAVLLAVLLHTGARVTEALNLSAGDLDQSTRTVSLKGLKGSDDREIPLPDWLFDALLKLSRLTESGPIIPRSYHWARDAWVFYRPVKKPLHCLRHTFAVELYKKCRDILLVKQALGHRSISNTMVYASYVHSSEDLRRVLIG